MSKVVCALTERLEKLSYRIDYDKVTDNSRRKNRGFTYTKNVRTAKLEKRQKDEQELLELQLVRTYILETAFEGSMEQFPRKEKPAIVIKSPTVWE